MRRWACWIVLAGVAACQTANEESDGRKPEKPPVEKKPANGARVGMPEGFRVVGKPRVEAAYLDADAAWRALRSRLKTLQAEAVSRSIDILVTFESDGFHATTRGGTRRTWELPPDLRLSGVPTHLLLTADYTLRLYRADHSQVRLAGEVTVVGARVGKAGAGAREFRLTIKGGRTIRSISVAG